MGNCAVFSPLGRAISTAAGLETQFPMELKEKETNTKAAKVWDFIFCIAWLLEYISPPALSGYKPEFPLRPAVLEMYALLLLCTTRCHMLNSLQTRTDWTAVRDHCWCHIWSQLDIFFYKKPTNISTKSKVFSGLNEGRHSPSVRLQNLGPTLQRQRLRVSCCCNLSYKDNCIKKLYLSLRWLPRPAPTDRTAEMKKLLCVLQLVVNGAGLM